MPMVVVLVLLAGSPRPTLSVTRNARDSASRFDDDFSTAMVVAALEIQDVNY